MINFGVIVSARTKSKRLPAKCFLPLYDDPSIVHLLKSIQSSSYRIYLATTESESDDILTQEISKLGFEVFRGSENNVALRLLTVAKKNGLDYIGRVTGDCPFVNSNFINYCIQETREFAEFDLVTTKGMTPKGIDIEIIKTTTLEEAINCGLTVYDQEHVTSFIYRNASKYVIKYIGQNYPRNKEIDSFLLDDINDYLKLIKISKMGKNYDEIIKNAQA